MVKECTKYNKFKYTKHKKQTEVSKHTKKIVTKIMHEINFNEQNTINKNKK